jgi:hypothetical protein
MFGAAMKIGPSITVQTSSWKWGDDRKRVAYGVLHITASAATYTVKEVALEGSGRRSATAGEQRLLGAMSWAPTSVFQTISAGPAQAWETVTITLDRPAPCAPH